MIKKITYSLILWLIANSISLGQTLESVSANAMTVFNNGNGAQWFDTNSPDFISTIDTNYIEASFVLGDSNSATLSCTQFQTSIPDQATITGIRVSITRKRDGFSLGNVISDSTIQLTLQGSPAGENKAIPNSWQTNDSTVIYGDTNDTWGLALTPDDFNTDIVGLDILLNYADNADTTTAMASINELKLEVFYQNDSTISNQQIATENEINYLYPLQSGYSSYQINGDGSAKIFNKEGQEIQSFNIPNSWDGTDYKGDLLPNGIYYLIKNEIEVFPIMIIR